MTDRGLQALCGGALPELVMFDLDGTLVDSAPDLAGAIDHMLVAAGYAPAGEVRVRQWVGNGAQMLVRRALAWAAGTAPDTLSSARVELHMQTFLRFYGDHCGDQTRLFAGVLEGLEVLRELGVELTLVTNKPAQFVPAILAATAIDGFFSHWLGGDSLPQKKPHPAPLRYLLEKTGTAPAKALMVGDSRTDIDAARAAGVAVVAVDYGYNPGRPVAEEEPDLLISDLALLARALRGRR
jgi:phosphoglycolate phosphatase